MMCFRRLLAPALLGSWLVTPLDRGSDVPCWAAEPPGSEDAPAAEKIVPSYKTDAQWKKLLTTKQFEVTRRKTTETPYTGKYWNNHRHGTYRCVCCDLELFPSDTKFESNTGWPSFWQPLNRRHIALAQDLSDPNEARVEVLCARREAHLGHVFNDGPAPTFLRYCMNSAALSFTETAKPSSRGGKKND